MKNKSLIITLAITLFLTIACSNDMLDDTLKSRTDVSNYPIVELEDLTICKSSIIISGIIVNSDNVDLRRVGFVYSKINNEPLIKGYGCTSRPASIDENGVFTSTMTLAIGTTYYIRAFAISSLSDTVYSEIDSLKIKPQKPKIETMPVENRTKKAAIVYGRFKDSGNKALKLWGCCISKHAIPTIEDKFEMAADTATDEVYHGEFGVLFDSLTSNTLYHVRAYAVTEDNDTVYGEDRIFKTSNGGNFTWHWASNYEGAVADGAAERIETALDSAMHYYNDYSNLEKHISVQYSPGVPTADCSITGWMRFGKNSRYQWVGTAEHETAHALGVGTASNWRTMLTGGKWNKSVAQRTLRAIMKDQIQFLKGDNMHFWNGGINQQEEVTKGSMNSHGVLIKGERILKGNAMIVNGMRIDGMTGY